MVTKVFSGGGLVILGAAVVLLSAGLAHAAPPRMHPPLPHHGGPPIGHFRHPVHYVHHGYYRPHYGGYSRGFRFYYPFYGHAYGQAYGGYGASYGYSYDRSALDYGSVLTAPATPTPTAEEREVGALLAASGVPTDEGRPAWPVALRVLPGQEAQALRGQIDALFQVAATEAAQGRPNTAAVEELGQATGHLRKLLLRHQEERGVLAQHSYEEAKRFLDKLAGAQKLLR